MYDLYAPNSTYNDFLVFASHAVVLINKAIKGNLM